MSDSRPGRVKLKVLFIDNTFTFGGAIVSLSRLVAGLRARGVEAVVVSGQPRERLLELFPSASVHSIDLYLPWVEHPERGGVDQSWILRLVSTLSSLVRGDLLPAFRLAAIGHRERVNLVHLNNSSMQTDGALAAKILRLPCVAHNRGVPPENLVRTARLRAGLATHHIGVSAEVCRALGRYGVPPERRSAIHNAVDLERFSPGPPKSCLRTTLDVPESAPLVGFFGRLVRWKGVLEFVDAIAHVRRGLPHVRALIVGDRSDGPIEYVREVEDRIHSLGLSSHIKMPGFRSDLPELYRLCDVVAHTSIEPEPFGLVVIEAMACATPVVAADFGGPIEIVRHGVDGFLADPRNPAEFAAHLLRLLKSAEFRRRMGKAARVGVERRFSQDRYAAEVHEVYRKVLEAP